MPATRRYVRREILQHAIETGDADDGTGSRPTGAPITGTEVSFDPTTGSTGDRDNAFAAPVTLQPGVYWAGWMLVSGSAMTAPTVVIASGAVNAIGLATLGNNSHRCWAQSGSGSAAAMPTVGTLFRAGSPPLVGAKVQ